MLPDYILPHHLPPPARPLTLTLTARGCAYLSKALAQQLNLRTGQPVDLLPPSAECAHWQLDLRPTALRRLSWSADTRPRIRSLRLPVGLLSPGTSLTLALVPTSLTRPGLHPLTVARATDHS